MDEMQFRQLPILVAAGSLWGALTVAITLVPAAALAGYSSALSTAVIAVGVVVGSLVLVKWTSCTVSIRDDGVRVRGSSEPPPTRSATFTP